jgi:branched-chain amino acid transport system permease protein
MAIFMESAYWLSILSFIAIYAMLAVGMCLILGYTGQISFASAGFYGVGAYSTAILVTRFHVDPLLALVTAALFTGGIAFIIGMPVFRLRGFYLALVTLGFGIIVYVILMAAIKVTGGAGGILAIPPLSIGGFTFNTETKSFFLNWAIMLAGIAAALNIVNSRVGRACRSIVSDEAASSAMGVDIAKYKLQIFVVCAIYSSIAGSMYTFYMRFIEPPVCDFMLVIYVFVIVMLGGMGSVWGGFSGALCFIVIKELISAVVPLTGLPTGEYEMILFGIMLIVILIFMPHGLMGGLSKLGQRISSTKFLFRV